MQSFFNSPPFGSKPREMSGIRLPTTETVRVRVPTQVPGTLFSKIKSKRHESSSSSSEDDDAVHVYVLFKGPQLSVYIPNVSLSHWQIVCHFKDTDEYRCYEMIIDKDGRITYDITHFHYSSTIYFCYLGECDLTKKEIKKKAKKVPVNGEKYIVGINDCQKWAKQFLNNLDLTLKGDGRAFMAFAAHRLTTALTPSVKSCSGHRKLKPYD
ncbi:unnamed protein product [Adineta ricciae]|uniref:Uncharacterized protein n=1 Tax=Adineta ricciae TaxID=249248 RepID=A0A815ZGH5_ADIRI|nr:unnamed protein product [Adineta ricciae]CAF1584494.1 unnamed protein product [Adineta ricciae]